MNKRLSKIQLARVKYVPKDLEVGVLYIAEEFGAAVHLCACGCGIKVSTPLKPTEWAFVEWEGGATLYPSIGNWQLPCRSHYWIWNGRIVWAGLWTQGQIEAGRRAEDARRRAYFGGEGVEDGRAFLEKWKHTGHTEPPH